MTEHYEKPEKEKGIDEQIWEGIKRLMGYAYKAEGEEETEFPILVLAPELGSPDKPKTHLRVYAYGGVLGTIPTDKNKKGTLVSKDYLKYLPESTGDRGKLKKKIEDLEARRIDTLFSNEYLNLALKACRRRFTQNNGIGKERRIETKFIKKYLNNKDGWIPIDMEFAFPKQWMGGKNVRQDIVIYDKNAGAFRMIELKSNIKSCYGKSGLLKHYQDATDIMKLNEIIRNDIIKECFRKMKYLCDYGIIGGEVWEEVLKNTNRENVDLKFGCLFIGEDLGKYQTYVRHVREKIKDFGENYSFLYSPDIDTDIRKNCQMLSYDDFMRQRKEA